MQVASSPPQGGGPVGFGCGLLVGLIIGIAWWVYYEAPLLVIAIPAVVVGALGAIYGDRFWHWLIEWFPWLT